MRYVSIINRSQKQKGLSLVELIIYVAIIALLGVAVVRYTIGVTNVRNKSFAMEEVQAAGRVAIEAISSRLKDAESIRTASSTFGADPGVLSLTMTDASKNPTTIDLSADDGRLRITEGANAPLLITDELVSLSSLIFTDLTSTALRENVRVNIVIEYNNNDDTSFTATQTFQTSTSLRR